MAPLPKSINIGLLCSGTHSPGWGGVVTGIKHRKLNWKNEYVSEIAILLLRDLSALCNFYLFPGFWNILVIGMLLFVRIASHDLWKMNWINVIRVKMER